MSANTLLTQLRKSGAFVTANAGRLRIEAPPGALSDALRAQLAAQKPALLALLAIDATRARLLTLAFAAGLPVALAEGLPDEDLAACTGLPEGILRAYLGALERGLIMDAAIIPEGYSQPAECDGCGPVWLWPRAPARVKACPWCFRRKAGKAVPRPKDLRGSTS